MTPSFAVFAAVAALLTAWTLNRLWRRATVRYTQIVYTYGVKFFGLITFAWTILDYAARGASVRRVLVQLLVGIPISLWGGYAFGRTMARILKVGPGERAV